jgi:hypothetical protein
MWRRVVALVVATCGARDAATGARRGGRRHGVAADAPYEHGSARR